LILSSKPEERRSVFEEAAGITKYKSQRREAMSKLAMTDQNLARVVDVIGEVSRQIGSLKRQAAKAMRYKRLSFRLRHLSLAWNGYHHAQLAASLGALESKVAALQTEAQTRRSNLELQHSALEAKKLGRSHLNQRVQDAQQAVYDLRSKREQADNQANLAQIKRTGLEDRLKSSKANLDELEMQLREVTAQVDTGAQDKQMQLELLGGSDAVFQQRNREQAIVEGQLTKLEQDLQQAKFRVLQTESTVARLRTDCSGYEVDQKTAANRHEMLAQDVAGARETQTNATTAAEEVNVRVSTAVSEKTRANEEVVASQQAIGEITREFRDAQRKLQDIDRQLAQRTARLRLLQQLQERWEGFGEGAKALLQGRFTQALGGATLTPVTRGLEVKPAFGKAIEALLGSAAEAIAVADFATAQKILEQLEAGQAGSAVLKVAEHVALTAEDVALPAGLIPAVAALGDVDPAHPAVGVLSSCYVADDLGGFLAYWQANPSFRFLSVATRKGEIVDARGLVFGGHAKRSANSIVQREIDLRETSRALADDQKAHDEQKAVIDTLGARLAAAEKTLEERRAQVLAVTQTVAAAQADQRSAQRALEDATSRLRRLESELVSLEHARNETHARWEKAQAGLAEAETVVAQQRDAVQQLENKIVAARTERDVKRESLAQARLELAERRQKVEVLDRGLGEMERRRQQLSELLIQRQHEIETWTHQIGALERETEAQRAIASQLADTLGISQQEVEKIRVDLVELEKEITALEGSQAALHTQSESAHNQLSTHEVKLAETRQRAQFLAEEVTREYSAEIATIDWKHQLWHADDEPEGVKPLDLDDEDDATDAPATDAAPVADGAAATAEAAPRRRRKPKAPKGEATPEDLAALDATDWNVIKSEADALRSRLNSMGAVNLVAIEEYAELKQRFDFLKTQSDDLTSAKTALLKAIDEINQTSQMQFELTFEQIRKNFEYTFNTLFGGGKAALELIATEDILESGIEIVAQPPGTKLKSITLLSGGQKTLTAVALLFALYMVKPSPFCLLDELDAPLDESNIGRFTDLLKKFVGESQFIIITHSKRTVSAANAIYGVTMEERGVSKTVSMRFNQERGEAEAAHPTNIAQAVRAVAAPPAPGT